VRSAVESQGKVAAMGLLTWMSSVCSSSSATELPAAATLCSASANAPKLEASELCLPASICATADVSTLHIPSSSLSLLLPAPAALYAPSAAKRSASSSESSAMGAGAQVVEQLEHSKDVRSAATPTDMQVGVFASVLRMMASKRRRAMQR
jgi:hypothetical protein